MTCASPRGGWSGARPDPAECDRAPIPSRHLVRGRPTINLAREPVRLALFVAIVLLIQPSRPTPALLTFLGVAILALLLAIRRPNARVAIAILLIGGLGIRLAIRSRVGSDVLDVTAEAIDRVLAGLNPYGVGYASSRPPNAPFPYGPLAIFTYVPVADSPRLLELFSATIVATVLALRGRLLGLAIYATTAAIVNTSVDGSNDTTLGLLLLATFALAPRRPVLAGVVLAAAVAFKLSAAAWVPAFLLWGGLRVAGTFGLATLVFWFPVLVVWGPATFISSLSRANQLHTDIVWSLGMALRDVLGPDAVRVLDNLRFGAGAAVALWTLRFARSLDGVIVAGTLVYLVTLFGGTWATFAYFAAIAPLLCWRIDDWLGLPTEPLAGRDLGESIADDPAPDEPDAPGREAPPAAKPTPAA